MQWRGKSVTEPDGDPATTSDARVLEEVAPGVARVLRTVLGDGHRDLDDAVQESLIALLAALGQFRGQCSLQRYANRIAVRVGVRTRQRSKALLIQDPDEYDEAAPVGDCPEYATCSARRLALLHSLLDDLPVAQADTLALRVVAGLSLPETAEVMGVPLNTVRSRMRLARLALRSRAEAELLWQELLESGQ